MKLLVVRHGIADDRKPHATARSDEQRPLTKRGRTRMAGVAEGLRVLVPKLDLIASSPLVRARQTAEIVADAYDVTVGETTEVLRPDARVSDFTKWLASHDGLDVVAVVGHEPHLSALVTWLVAGLDASRVVLKKGGACLLEFERPPRRGGAVLHWLSRAKELRSATRKAGSGKREV